MTSSELETKDKLTFAPGEDFAKRMDGEDKLGEFRSQFLIPKTAGGNECLYFAGNSLGLQPKNARKYIEEELEDWARLGVEGHWDARHPWLPYHEFLTEMR